MHNAFIHHKTSFWSQFWAFWPQKSQILSAPVTSNKMLQKFNASTCCKSNFMQKIRKVPCTDFSTKIQSLILGPFWSKNLKTKSFQKIIQGSFKSLCHCSFMPKSEKFHVLAFHNTRKPHFGHLLRNFWHKNCKTSFFPKGLCCCNFLQKIGKIPCINFS